MWGMETLIMKAQLRWVGHVVRMRNDRLPKMIFPLELATGATVPGGPIKRFTDGLRTTLKACDIVARSWESLARDENARCLAVSKGVAAFKECQLLNLDRKRAAHRERWINPAVAVVCLMCNCLCVLQFELELCLWHH